MNGNINTLNSIPGHCAYKLSYERCLGHGQFDPINKMIILIMIPLSGVHCFNLFNSIQAEDDFKLSYNRFLGLGQFDPNN